MEKRIYFFRYLAITSTLLLATIGGNAQNTDENFKPFSGQAGKDVVWVPTPQALVDTMLALANVTSSDYVIDLGSGDGRLVITAAKRGATALGIEYNPDMVEYARRAATNEGVTAKATFENADIFESDFSKATVITLFLMSDLNLRLRPKILDMKPGTRIVSNTFNMNDWEPDHTSRIEEESNWKTAHLWIVPAKIGGVWKLDGGQIQIDQKFQQITGTLTMGNVVTKFAGKLKGNEISVDAGGTAYTGTVNGNTISVTSAGGGTWNVTR